MAHIVSAALLGLTMVVLCFHSLRKVLSRNYFFHLVAILEAFGGEIYTGRYYLRNHTLEVLQDYAWFYFIYRF